MSTTFNIVDLVVPANEVNLVQAMRLDEARTRAVQHSSGTELLCVYAAHIGLLWKGAFPKGPDDEPRLAPLQVWPLHRFDHDVQRYGEAVFLELTRRQIRDVDIFNEGGPLLDATLSSLITEEDLEAATDPTEAEGESSTPSTSTSA